MTARAEVPPGTRVTNGTHVGTVVVGSYELPNSVSVAWDGLSGPMNCLVVALKVVAS